MMRRQHCKGHLTRSWISQQSYFIRMGTEREFVVTGSIFDRRREYTANRLIVTPVNQPLSAMTVEMCTESTISRPFQHTSNWNNIMSLKTLPYIHESSTAVLYSQVYHTLSSSMQIL